MKNNFLREKGFRLPKLHLYQIGKAQNIPVVTGLLHTINITVFIKKLFLLIIFSFLVILAVLLDNNERLFISEIHFVFKGTLLLFQKVRV